MEHYYVDGYNLLFYLHDDPDSDLESQRDDVLELINSRAALLNLSITVVFDAGAAPVTHRYSHRDIEVAFADSSTNADEWIHEHVEHSANPKAVTVVTNDKRLGKDCKYLGAKVQSISAWMRWLDKAAGRIRRNSVFDGVAGVVNSAPQPKRRTPATKEPQQPSISSSDPDYFKRQPGESEQERWQRIFESRLK